jgi:disulfide oxidoreductase YuzD
MLVTIVAVLGLIGILAIIGLGYLIYSSFLKNNNTMNADTKTKAVDVFVYLGIAISLVVSVTNLLQMIFAAINRKFPDITSAYQYMDVYNSDIRLAIASLVVMYPLYVILSWYVARDIKKFTYKRDIPIRRTMIYTALFVTIITLIGTLVSIIYTFLGGELTVRFGFKALATFVVALTVFGYYLYSLKRKYEEKTVAPVVVTIVATLLVFWAVIWSIMTIGSPAQMRALRIDNTRLSDLSTIQQQVVSQFQTTEKLPTTLSDLNNALQGYAVPTDPVTKESYVYRVVQQPVIKMNFTLNRKEMTTPGVFEICATFDNVREYDNRGMPTLDKGGMTDMMYSVSNYYYEGDQTPFWNHGIGQTCFRREIGPEMYYGR